MFSYLTKEHALKAEKKAFWWAEGMIGMFFFNQWTELAFLSTWYQETTHFQIQGKLLIRLANSFPAHCRLFSDTWSLVLAASTVFYQLVQNRAGQTNLVLLAFSMACVKCFMACVKEEDKKVQWVCIFWGGEGGGGSWAKPRLDKWVEKVI